MSTLMNIFTNLLTNRINNTDKSIDNLKQLKIKNRLEIDLIDDEIIKLLEQRKKCCQNIGKIKYQLNETIISTIREDEILQRLKSKSNILESSEIDLIYNNLFKIFRNVQIENNL